MYLSFNHPEYLWYLLSIPLLVASHFAFLKYTRRKAMRFANFQALKKVSDQKIVTKNYTLLIIRCLVLISLILAISGSTLWYMGSVYSNDYVIAIDTSSSMTAQDFRPSRLDASKEYTMNFLDNLDSESSIGVVSFSGAAFIEQIPTTDVSVVKNAVSQLGAADVGGTNIPDALITASNLLITSKNGRVIILITDGSNTGGYFTKDPINEGIKYAKQNHVIVNTIGVGSNAGPIGYLPEYYNISSVYDENTLIRIANGTGGKFYNASNNEDLVKAYSDIVSQSKDAYLSIDLGQGLLIVALGLVFLEWGLVSTRFRAMP